MPDSLTWYIHFAGFLIFGAMFFKKNKWGMLGVIVGVLAYEIDQALGFRPGESWTWFLKLDTWLDIIFGLLGGFVGWKYLNYLTTELAVLWKKIKLKCIMHLFFLL